jgi:diadenosine tetraphosphatase ApaH/serine/threonine PP2A family protein phosphatase
MRIAVVSDVHANLEALDAVLEDARRAGAEEIWSLGDVVGYGADPNPVVERLAAGARVAVAGNHDWAACGKMTLGYFNDMAARAAEWTSQALSETSRRWLAALPLERVERGIRLVHASPSDPAAWHYVLSESAAEGELSTFDETLCLIGHSHLPGQFEHNGSSVRYHRDARLSLARNRRYLVNVGSVGQPRDGDPRATYLLLDDAKRSLEHRRVPYDVESAARKILEAGLPSFLAERLPRGA